MENSIRGTGTREGHEGENTAVKDKPIITWELWKSDFNVCSGKSHSPM